MTLLPSLTNELPRPEVIRRNVDRVFKAGRASEVISEILVESRRSQMTDLENLIRDLDALRESIKLHSVNLHHLPPAQLKTVLEHVTSCRTEIESLQAKLRTLTVDKPASG